QRRRRAGHHRGHHHQFPSHRTSPAVFVPGKRATRLNLAAVAEVIVTAAAQAPPTVGIYCLLAGDGELLYVGKAANIRTRLRQHAAAGATDHARLGRLYSLTREVRWQQSADADAAAAREADVVVALRPRFNAAIG